MSITRETRREAYQESRRTAPKRQSLVYDCLRHHGPQTAEELVKRLGYRDMNSVRPRLTELKDLGLVRTTGKRPSSTGRMTAVWEVRK